MQLGLGTQMFRAALARAGGPVAEFDAANGIVEGKCCKGKGKDRSHPYDKDAYELAQSADPEVNNDEGNNGNNDEGYSKMMEKFRAARAQRWDVYERAQQSGEPEGNNDEGNNNDEPKGINDEDAME